jgi:hypothetical protein
MVLVSFHIPLLLLSCQAVLSCHVGSSAPCVPDLKNVKEFNGLIAPLKAQRKQPTLHSGHRKENSSCVIVYTAHGACSAPT